MAAERLASTVWTVGHSTHEIGTFIDLLRPQGIELLVDVRRHAGSRRYPQYNPPALQRSLAEHHIAYRAMPELGGRRTPRPDSINTAWRNSSFRGYADYMQTAEFARALTQLLDMAAARRTALLCAETLWWQCHRALIADALKVRGIRVFHILSNGQQVEHPYTAPARIVDGELLYGSGSAALFPAG